MWATEEAWAQVLSPAHGLYLDRLIPRTSSRLAHCGVMLWKAKKQDPSKRSRTSATRLCCLCTITLVTV